MRRGTEGPDGRPGRSSPGDRCSGASWSPGGAALGASLSSDPFFRREDVLGRLRSIGRPQGLRARITAGLADDIDAATQSACRTGTGPSLTGRPAGHPRAAKRPPRQTQEVEVRRAGTQIDPICPHHEQRRPARSPALNGSSRVLLMSRSVSRCWSAWPESGQAGCASLGAGYRVAPVT